MANYTSTSLKIHIAMKRADRSQYSKQLIHSGLISGTKPSQKHYRPNLVVSPDTPHKVQNKNMVLHRSYE